MRVLLCCLIILVAGCTKERIVEVAGPIAIDTVYVPTQPSYPGGTIFYIDNEDCTCLVPCDSASADSVCLSLGYSGASYWRCMPCCGDSAVSGGWVYEVECH